MNFERSDMSSEGLESEFASWSWMCLAGRLTLVGDTVKVAKGTGSVSLTTAGRGQWWDCWFGGSWSSRVLLLLLLLLEPILIQRSYTNIKQERMKDNLWEQVKVVDNRCGIIIRLILKFNCIYQFSL